MPHAVQCESPPGLCETRSIYHYAKGVSVGNSALESALGASRLPQSELGYSANTSQVHDLTISRPLSRRDEQQGALQLLNSVRNI